MAVIISLDLLKDIAGNLEMGMNCWYHIPTGKVLSIPGIRENDDFDDEIWEDTLNEIKEKKHECISFGGLDPHKEFKIMESFAENEVKDPEVRSRLIYALNQRKPFLHFKSAIHKENENLEAWYAFKLKCYMEHVQKELEFYNSNNVNIENGE